MSRRVIPGKFTVRRGASGVAILCDGMVINGIAMSELRSAASLAEKWRHLSDKPWMTRELFAKISGHVCVLLNVP